MQDVKTSAMTSIRNSVLRHLTLSRDFDQRQRPQTHRLEFRLDWSLNRFLEQYKRDWPVDAIGRVITLTGNPTVARAATCQDYMVQIWPFTGLRTLNSIRDAISRYFHIPECTFRPSTIIDHLETKPCFNKTVLSVSGSKASTTTRCTGDSLHVVTTGNISEVAEVAEQLAWFGAAVRSSNERNHSASCFPKIALRSRFPNSFPVFRSSWLFDIEFPLSDLEKPTLGGTCWHSMFQSAVVVSGYPIPSRSGAGLGIEIPLEIAADLLYANSVATFNGRPIIKGFSSLLYPIHYRNGIVFWHLITNSDGERISHADPRVGSGSEIEPSQLSHNDLETARHVVGWCRDVKLLAGKFYPFC